MNKIVTIMVSEAALEVGGKALRQELKAQKPQMIEKAKRST